MPTSEQAADVYNAAVRRLCNVARPRIALVSKRLADRDELPPISAGRFPRDRVSDPQPNQAVPTGVITEVSPSAMSASSGWTSVIWRARRVASSRYSTSSFMPMKCRNVSPLDLTRCGSDGLSPRQDHQGRKPTPSLATESRQSLSTLPVLTSSLLHHVCYGCPPRRACNARVPSGSSR
jgi:hypothetical protein